MKTANTLGAMLLVAASLLTLQSTDTYAQSRRGGREGAGRSSVSDSRAGRSHERNSGSSMVNRRPIQRHPGQAHPGQTHPGSNGHSGYRPAPSQHGHAARPTQRPAPAVTHRPAPPVAHRSHYHHAPAHYRPAFCHHHHRPHFGCRYVRHIGWPAPLVVYVASVPYYYDRGVFYVQRYNDYYETVVPPVGAIVPEIPDDYSIVVIDGYEYYQVDRTLYKFIDYNGQPAFEVVGQLN